MSADIKATAADPVTRPLEGWAYLIMVGLCLTWGFNQVATKLAMPDIPPLIQATLRSFGGAILVLLWSVLRRIPLMQRDGTLKAGIIAGILFGLEFVLIYRGLLYTTASRAILFVYTMPFFVVLMTRWYLPSDRFRPSQWFGLILSFIGIMVAFGVPGPQSHPLELVGDLMMVVGAVLWAATTVYIKASPLARVSSEKTTLYQLVVSIPVLGIAALALGERILPDPSALAIGSVVYQSVWVVGITYMIWFGMIQRYSANRLAVFIFLAPLFGVAAGHLVLGDPLTPGFLFAVALVTLGIILVNRPR